MRLKATRANIMKAVLLALALLVLAGNLAAQQETGRIIGTVKDPSGAVVPGAAVTTKNMATSSQRSFMTGGDGTYVVTNLQPGAYEVSIAKQGFNTGKRQVTVAVGGITTADFALTVGAEPTTVVVSGAAIQVNVESQSIANVISTKQILELPTITRNPYDLVAIAGNASPGDSRDYSRGTGFNINGQRSASTNILLDGSDNNDNFVAGVGQSVPLDSVQEFSVVSSSFTAEYGRASGGVVNVATKSGTNEFHGTLYEFNRVSKMTSNSFDNNAQNIPKSPFVRNQFGFSVGGPVKKDKLFFFNNTEWFRVRSTSTQTALIPMPQFISAAATNTQQFFSTYGNLKIQPNGIIYTKAMIPNLCNATGPCANLPASTPIFGTVNYPVPADAGGGDPRNEIQTVTRIDYNISDKTTIYGRYATQKQNFFIGTNGESPYKGFDTGTDNFNNNFLLNVTRTFSPKLVSQSKVVHNRLNNLQPLGENVAGPTLYFSSASQTSKVLGQRVALPGYLPFSPGNAIPFGGPQNLSQLYEDVSWVAGAHILRFGGQYIYLRDNRAFGAYQEAVEQLGTNLKGAMDNFLLGQLSSFQAAVYPQGKFPGDTLTLPVGQPDFTRSNRYHDFAFYAQDTWRVKPRVTLNLGLRWEYYGVQHNKDPFKDSNFYLGTGATLEEKFKNGKVMLAPNSPNGGLWAKDTNNFAPRFGFAWDVTGTGKTSLRAGYGISYERNFGNVTFNVIQNPPNYAVVQLGPSDVGGNLPVTINNMGPLAGSSGTKVLPRSSLRAVNENIKTAYAHFWSAALEHEVMRNTVFSLEYTASKGVGLYTIDRMNKPGSGAVYFGQTGSPLSTYSNSQYAVVNYRTADGYSNYHGMVAGIRSQNLFNQGLQLTFNWTWSHALDNNSSTFGDENNYFNLGLLDPYNPSLDYGSAAFDVRHRVAISGIWALPYAKNITGFAKHVLDGWNLAPIFSARTGAPYSIYDCWNGYYLCNRMILVSSMETTGTATPISTLPNQFKFLDLTSQLSGTGDNAYFHPISGTADFGPYPAKMSGRNIFRAPGFWEMNLGIYKNFKLPKEGYSLQFRAEAYNLFNHSNLLADTASADISAVDYIPALRGGTGSAAERRNIQFALKFIF